MNTSKIAVQTSDVIRGKPVREKLPTNRLPSHETRTDKKSVDDSPGIPLPEMLSSICPELTEDKVNAIISKEFSRIQAEIVRQLVLELAHQQSEEDESLELPVGLSNVKNGKPKIVVIIPTYNEERFIGSTVVTARKYTNTVIVIDDGSTDCSAEVARNAGAIVMSHDLNKGKGAALNTGICKAMEFNPSVVVTLDGDGQHSADEIPLVIDPILKGEADIVIGSRYLEKRSIVPTHRILGHWMINRFIKLLSGVAVTDSQSGFRAFSARSVETISFCSQDFSVESEMQFIAREQHLRIVEAPIVIQYKDKPKRPVLKQGVMVLNGILQITGQYRPLLYFGMAGIFLLFLGLIIGLWVVGIYRTYQVLAVGYTIISMIFLVLGWMALMTGITLHSIRGLIMRQFQINRENHK